jgi:hypothetical protein
MIKIIFNNNEVVIYNTDYNIQITYLKSDLGVKLFNIYDTSKPNNKFRHCSIFNIYTGNDITIFNAETIDPDSDFYTDNFDEYARLIADYVTGEFICLEDVIYLSYESNDYYLTDKSGNDNDALLVNSNCKYYDGSAGQQSIFTDTIIGLLDKITINYSTDGDDWSNTYDSDTDVNEGFWQIENDYSLQIGYDGNSYYTGWIGLVEGFDSEGEKLFSFTMASGSDNQDISRIIQYELSLEGEQLTLEDKKLIEIL